MGPNPLPPEPPKRLPRRAAKDQPIRELDGVGPVEREKVARWLEAQIQGQQQHMEQIAFLQSTGQDFPGSMQQFTYASIGISWLKQLAWRIRTSRGGPLGGKPRRVQKCVDAAIESKMAK